MQFIYNDQAGTSTLTLTSTLYHYLIRVRRSKINDTIHFRNHTDSYLYSYIIDTITPKKVVLHLQAKTVSDIIPSRPLHLGWSVVDIKVIEKSLPFINEIGVQTLSFIYSDFSQRNISIKLEKLYKILDHSSQQCGRSKQMKLMIYQNLETFLTQYPNSTLVNFTDKKTPALETIDTIIIGPEGGFSQREQQLVQPTQIVGFNSPLILRSETAAIAMASKLLL